MEVSSLRLSLRHVVHSDRPLLHLSSIDNIFCNQLRELRHKIGYPWAILLEGHGWWHIGTGYGAYLIVVASEMLVLSIKEKPDNFAIAGSKLVPFVKRVKPFQSTKGENGVVAKSRKSK